MKACQQLLSASVSWTSWACFFGIRFEALQANAWHVKRTRRRPQRIRASIPSGATGCCSPWHSPDSPASSPARKASPFGPWPASTGRFQARPRAGSPSGGCWWPGSPLEVGSAPPRGGWRCSCRGRAARCAVGAPSRSLRPTGRPGRRGSGPAGGPCQGEERERGGREDAPPSRAERGVRWVSSFVSLSLLCLALVKLSLKTLTMSSFCLLSPTPAAPVLLFADASRSLLQPSSCSRSSSWGQTESTHRKREIDSYCSFSTPAGACSSVQETHSGLPSHHLSLYWKSCFSSLRSFRAAWVHVLVRRRGGVERRVARFRMLAEVLKLLK